MSRSIDGVIAWAKANPLYTYKDGTGRKKSWAGLCEAFVNNAGDFGESFGSALLAGNASGPLNKNWGQAPRGAIHYWAGVGGDGHVAFELGGGTLLMASSRTSNFGTALGTIHFTDYGLPEYRGWSMRHGTETLAPSTTTAGSGPTPLEDDMPLTIADVQLLLEQKVEVTPGRWVSIAQSIRDQYYFGDADSARDAVTLKAVNEDTRIANETWKIVSEIKAKPSSVIDPAKLAAELKAAGLAVTIDSAAFVKAIDASLSDNFAAVPAAVVASLKAAL